MDAPKPASAGPRLPEPIGRTRAQAHEKAADSLSRLLEDIAACRAEILRKEAVAEELEKRLRVDLGKLESQWIALRVQTFRSLGRRLREGGLPRKSQKLLAEALASLADELEIEYGADLRADRRLFLGEDPEEAIADAAPRRGGKPSGQASEAGHGEGRDPRGVGKDGAGPRGETHAWEEDLAAGPGGKGRPGDGRPGSKAALRRAAKERSLAGDIRALYLILARALHPDKEGNPALREAKTVWMQKVTDAYARKDLALLLDILARNPLEAVGPYLAEAPLKTVQGFAKRLRRELAALKEQSARAGEWLHPSFASFLKNGAIDEARVARHLGEMKRAVRLARQRLEAYRTPEGALHLVDGLKQYDWRDLL